MRRRQLRIRRWFTLAFALVALSLASSASAMVAVGDGGGGGYSQEPVAASPSSGGFDWSDAAIGAGIALGVALGTAGILRLASSRRRLAGQSR